MKKIIGLLLCAAMLLTFASCGDSDAAPTTPAIPSVTAAPTAPAATEAPAATVAPAEETAAPAAPAFSPRDPVLVDTDAVSFAVVKAEHNAHLGMQLQVQCVNKTERTLMFSWDTVSVCGYMYDPLWSEEVGVGETVQSTVQLDTFVLGKMGIDSVDEISFTLRIYDSENWMDPPLVEEIFSLYPTGLSAETFTLPPHAFSDDHVVIAEDQNVRFVVEGVTDDELSGYTVHVYLENKTGGNLLYVWDRSAVNGKAAEAFWSMSVGAGKRACAEITFPRALLEQLGITEVTGLEFALTVSDYDNWESGNLLEGTYSYKP